MTDSITKFSASSLPPQNRFQRALYYKDLITFLFFFSCILVLNHAGGHVVAGAVGLGAFFGLIGQRIPHPKTWPIVIWASLFFIVYFAISNLWSTDNDPGLYSDSALYSYVVKYSNVVKFAVGAPISALLIWVMTHQPRKLKTLWRIWLGYGVLLSAIVFSFDILSGFALTKSIDPSALPQNIDANISHGISVLLVIIWPALLMVFHDKKATGTLREATMVAAGILIAFAIFRFSNFASIIVIIAASLAALCAVKWPKTIINALFTVLTLSLIFAPWLGFAASKFTETQKAGLPFSWEWRVETWGFIWKEILENPLIGHGFGALRGYDETFSSRGFESLSIIPTHAHNAGLHLWVEGGGLGILITVIALWFIRRAVITADWLTPQRSIAIAGGLAAIIVYASLSYSVWQDWWIGTIALFAAMIPLIPVREAQ